MREVMRLQEYPTIIQCPRRLIRDTRYIKADQSVSEAQCSPMG